MKKIIPICLIICTLIPLSKAQFYKSYDKHKNYEAYPCYAVASNNLGPNVLFEYDQESESWAILGEIGPVGGTINAIATDPINNIIYAYDNGNKVLGIIDVNATNSTFFTPINTANIGNGVGTANGDYGPVALNYIKGLTYDPVNMVLYGIHYINSGDYCNPIANTNDLLFKIDVSTGSFIPGAMSDASGVPTDYALIEEAIIGPTKLSGEPLDDITIHHKKNSSCIDCTTRAALGYDVNDIAYNPYTGELFAAQHHKSSICSPIISILNQVDGSVETYVIDPGDQGDMAGLGFDNFGVLYGTSTNNTVAGYQNTFTKIDLQDQTLQVLPFPDPTGTYFNFEAFDCLTAFNDLALKQVLNPSFTNPIYRGDTVIFNITVYNQGDFDNTDILITNYIPTGLTLVDYNWQAVPGTNTAEAIIPGPLLKGSFITIPITFTVNPTYSGVTINNYAEITSSFNQNVTYNGDPIPLPDIDSEPDANNNEIVYGNLLIDNEINQGGPNANEDEDDHDIASITVTGFAGNLLLSTTIKPATCNSLGKTEISLIEEGTPPYTHKWLGPFGSLIHLETNNNTTHTINDLLPGIYYVIVSDAADKISAFVLTVPLLASNSGNLNCTTSICPKYLETPSDSLFGIFEAEETIEINGFVNGTQNAEFRICD